MKEILGRRGAQGHDLLRFDYVDLGLQPGTTGSDLLRVGFFVDTTFAARLPFKMFDNIGDVGLVPIDASFCQRGVKQPTGGNNKGVSGKKFFVYRLFSNKPYLLASSP